MVIQSNRRKATIVSIASSNRYSLRSRSIASPAKIDSTTPFLKRAQEAQKLSPASPLRSSTRSEVPFETGQQQTAENTQKSTISPQLPCPPIGTSTPRVEKPKSVKISQREITKKCYGFSLALMRRFAREMGIKRMSKGCHEEIVGLVADFVGKLAEDATIYCQSRNRRTITVDDLQQALKLQGRRIYGYDNYDEDLKIWK